MVTNSRYHRKDEDFDLPDEHPSFTSPYFHRPHRGSYGSETDFDFNLAGAQEFNNQMSAFGVGDQFVPDIDDLPNDSMMESVQTLHGSLRSQDGQYAPSIGQWATSNYSPLNDDKSSTAGYSFVQADDAASSRDGQNLLSPLSSSYAPSAVFSHFDGSAGAPAFEMFPPASPSRTSHRPVSVAGYPQSSGARVSKRRRASDYKRNQGHRAHSFSASTGESQPSKIPEELDRGKDSALRSFPQNEFPLVGMQFAENSAIGVNTAVAMGFPVQVAPAEASSPQEYNYDDYMALHDEDPNIARYAESSMYGAEKTDGKYVCPLCTKLDASHKDYNFTTTTKSAWIKHLDRHFKPFRCIGCPSHKFSSTATFNRHIREFHLDKFKYYCRYEDCERHENAPKVNPFPRALNRDDHERRIHLKANGEKSTVQRRTSNRQSGVTPQVLVEGVPHGNVDLISRIDAIMMLLQTFRTQALAGEPVPGLDESLINLQANLQGVQQAQTVPVPDGTSSPQHFTMPGLTSTGNTAQNVLNPTGVDLDDGEYPG